MNHAVFLHQDVPVVGVGVKIRVSTEQRAFSVHGPALSEGGDVICVEQPAYWVPTRVGEQLIEALDLKRDSRIYRLEMMLSKAYSQIFATATGVLVARVTMLGAFAIVLVTVSSPKHAVIADVVVIFRIRVVDWH